MGVASFGDGSFIPAVKDSDNLNEQVKIHDSVSSLTREEGHPSNISDDRSRSQGDDLINERTKSLKVEIDTLDTEIQQLQVSLQHAI